MKNIVVEGCVLQLQSGNGTITISPSQTTSKVKCDNKEVYTSLKFTISNYTGGAITVAGSGNGSGEIVSSAQKVKVDGVPCFLEGDQSMTITLNGLQPSGSGTAPAIATDIVTIQFAGQSKVKGV